MGKHVFHVLAVSLVITRPAAANIGILLEGKPKAIIVLLSYDQDDGIDLELCIFSSARSDEKFWFESSTFSEDEGVFDAEVKIDAF